MNRRNFLNTLVGGVATAAAVRTWPFRVYSFPTEVKPLVRGQLLEIAKDYYTVHWPSGESIEIADGKALCELGDRLNSATHISYVLEGGLAWRAYPNGDPDPFPYVEYVDKLRPQVTT